MQIRQQSEQQSERQSDRTTRRLADQLADRMADKPADQLGDRVADKPADQLADHVADKPVSCAELPGDHLLVVFDGLCSLCHWSVAWLRRRDHRDRLRFAASESAVGAALLAGVSDQITDRGREPSKFQGKDRSRDTVPFEPGNPGTIIVIAPASATVSKRALTRSEAVLACLGELDPPWPQIAAVVRLVPRPLRDLGYRVVARLRYRLAPRLESCPLPPPEFRHRFLN